MSRVYNFSAGPSVLPEKVLKDVQTNLLDYNGCGMSVLEMSHRSKEYSKIHTEAKQNLKKLMVIPDDYEILFMGGGATLQFSAIPLNLKKNGKADFMITGSWAKKAYKEAAKFLDAQVAKSSEDDNFTFIPKTVKDDFRLDADYVHICANNTIYGTAYSDFPDTNNVPLVADLSSNILSKKIDVNKCSLIYAGVQKNIAPAGMAIVIIKKDMIQQDRDDIPTYLNYAIHAENDSLYNTPPAFQIYFAGEVFKYLLDLGGLDEIEKINMRKAKLLYDFIDESSLFKSPVKEEDRSIMNVVFVTGDETKDKKFIEEAKTEGLVQLSGHRSIGGMRASIYNAMSEEGIKKLIDFMSKFEKGNK